MPVTSFQNGGALLAPDFESLEIFFTKQERKSTVRFRVETHLHFNMHSNLAQSWRLSFSAAPFAGSLFWHISSSDPVPLLCHCKPPTSYDVVTM